MNDKTSLAEQVHVFFEIIDLNYQVF